MHPISDGKLKKIILGNIKTMHVVKDKKLYVRKLIYSSKLRTIKVQ
jgi:hypothetical protein